MNSFARTYSALIIEGEMLIAADHVRRLRELGIHASQIVQSSAEALRFLEIQVPDLVLMNMRLKQEMKGIEILHRIRMRYAVPVLVITAVPILYFGKKVQHFDQVYVLEKPVDEYQFEGVVENVFQCTD